MAELAAEWERRAALIGDDAVRTDEVTEHSDDIWAALDRLRDTPSKSLKDVVDKVEITARLLNESRGNHEAAAELVDSALHDLRRLSAG